MKKKGIINKEKSNRKENLSSYIVKYIKNKILKGQYLPNEQIKENDLAKELKTSRAPIREALKLLEKDGIFYSIPNHGCFLMNFDQKDRIEIFQVRVYLESKILELLISENKLKESDFTNLEKIFLKMIKIARADIDHLEKVISITKLDLEFHSYLWKISESKIIFDILTSLSFKIKVAMIHDTLTSNNLEDSIILHFDMIQALKEGNKIKTIQILEEHIEEFYK